MDDDLPTLPDQPLLIFTREAAQKLVAAIRRRTVSVASGSIKVAAPHKAGKPDKTLRIGLGMRQTDDGVTLFLREASKKGDDSSAGSSGAGSDGSGDSASSMSSASSQSPESPVSGSHTSSSSDESSRAPSHGSSHGHSHPTSGHGSSSGHSGHSGESHHSGDSHGHSGGDSGHHSSKTAIVKFREEWIAWVNAEEPCAKLADTLVVPISGAGNARLAVEAEFIECCERGSIRVVSTLPDCLCLTTGSYDDREVRVRCAEPLPGEVLTQVIVRLEGVRKGHGERFKRYTAEQAEANRLFYNLAHDPAAWVK